ncbi:MAG: hypothetical protein IJN92_10035 [Lachnospiraceae bacterium]|nr:hypothetical protein [Lachnospiraceae bacterium]
MKYSIYKEIICEDTKKRFKVGDTVTVKLENGGGMGGCTIVKITDKGFHYNQGGRDKCIQYDRIQDIY